MVVDESMRAVQEPPSPKVQEPDAAIPTAIPIQARHEPSRIPHPSTPCRALRGVGELNSAELAGEDEMVSLAEELAEFTVVRFAPDVGA